MGGNPHFLSMLDFPCQNCLFILNMAVGDESSVLKGSL